jgi:hypothetical protein
MWGVPWLSLLQGAFWVGVVVVVATVAVGTLAAVAESDRRSRWVAGGIMLAWAGITAGWLSLALPPALDAGNAYQLVPWVVLSLAPALLMIVGCASGSSGSRRPSLGLAIAQIAQTRRNGTAEVSEAAQGSVPWPWLVAGAIIAAAGPSEVIVLFVIVLLLLRR